MKEIIRKATELGVRRNERASKCAPIPTRPLRYRQVSDANNDVLDDHPANSANQVTVKMITGDQTAIARETCRELDMGSLIYNADILTGVGGAGEEHKSV